MKSKRILSLVLAMIMVLGTFGTVFAQDEDTTYGEKIDWLIDQGIVEGNETGDYMLDQNIDRASVAKMVVHALDKVQVAEGLRNYKAPFVDVPVTHWSNGNINVVSVEGLMIGNLKSQFMPSNEISYAEVLTVLVRIVMGEDLVNPVWPTSYIAKAHELGIMEGVAVPSDFMAASNRKDILEMFYNAMIEMQIGNYYIVKGIVLENNRVERLAKDEIVVEILREMQISDFAEASRKEKGDQERFTIDPKVGDVEDLLGKVADFSINKAGEVVKINVDETYEVKTGDFKATRNKMGSYTVELDERYRDSDERIFRTYLNNDPLAYSDFYSQNRDNRDEFLVDYARITVKNGKVLFIDAFNFDDIMPVKEIKEIRDKETIVAYDDVRDGNTIEIEVKGTEVILVKDDVFTRGTLENVKVDNVIHEHENGYLVLQELAIEGKLDRITETRTVTSVVVDGKAYDIPTVSPKKAVYEFEANDRFYTLEADTAYRELDTFRGEEVRVLLDLGGKLQYIGSPVEFGDFVGIATRIVGRDMRVLGPDNESDDYRANLDTRVDALERATTGHQNLNEIERNALVYVNADGEELDTVIELGERIPVTSLDRRNITLAENLVEVLGRRENVRKDFRISDETTIYVINTNGVAEVRAIADVVKAYDKAEEADKEVKATVISESRYDHISIRGDKYARDDNAFAIALYGLDIEPKLEDAVYGKLLRYYDRRAGRSEIVVELTNGRQATFTLHSSINEEAVDFKVGLYYEIEESKDTEGLAVKVKKVDFDGHAQVTNIQGNAYTIAGEDNVLYEVRATEFFGRKPRAGDRISYVKNASRDLVLVVYPAVESVPVVTGVVEYVNVDATRIEIDGEVYKADANTRMLDENENIIAIGNADIKLKLFKGDRVKSIRNDRDMLLLSFVKLDAVVAPDKTALNVAKALAALLDGDDYTEESWTDLQDALDLPETTQAQVDAKVDAINDAIDALEPVLETDEIAGTFVDGLFGPHVRFDMPAGETEIDSATLNGVALDPVIFEYAVDLGEGVVNINAEGDVIKVVIDGVEYEVIY